MAQLININFSPFVFLLAMAALLGIFTRMILRQDSVDGLFRSADNKVKVASVWIFLLVIYPIIIGIVVSGALKILSTNIHQFGGWHLIPKIPDIPAEILFIIGFAGGMWGIGFLYSLASYTLSSKPVADYINGTLSKVSKDPILVKGNGIDDEESSDWKKKETITMIKEDGTRCVRSEDFDPNSCTDTECINRPVCIRLYNDRKKR